MTTHTLITIVAVGSLVLVILLLAIQWNNAKLIREQEKQRTRKHLDSVINRESGE